MRYLILSDIHANWEALAAVLEHVDGAYDKICCLGDLVGYGADPNRVIEWAREHCAAVIRGNHDKACGGLEDPVLFNPVAQAAVEWSLAEITPDNREYLRALRAGPLDVGDFILAHGSILDEDRYLLDVEDAASQFPYMPGRLAFFGHTHVQGGFFQRSAAADSNGGAPKLESVEFRFGEGDTCLVNPGSVGQPRDRNWEAACAVYDSGSRTVRYHRAPYDIEAAQAKILAAGLPRALAERLSLGR